jgi:hypothetical protein
MEWNTPACHRQAAHAGSKTPQRNNKLAGSLASPANEIVACPYTIRKRRYLAPTAAAPRCAATCCYPRHAYAYPANAAAAAAATADTASAGSAARAAATATASAEAAASPGGASATASTTTTASTGELHAAEGIFFVVEQLEGSQADVGNFLFTERDHHARCEIRSLNIGRWYGRSQRASCY